MIMIPAINGITVAQMMGVKLGFVKESIDKPREIPPLSQGWEDKVNQMWTDIEKMQERLK